MRLESELELEKQHSISEEVQKIRRLEAEASRLKPEVQVPQNEEGCHESLEERLKDF